MTAKAAKKECFSMGTAGFKGTAKSLFPDGQRKILEGWVFSQAASADFKIHTTVDA